MRGHEEATHDECTEQHSSDVEKADGIVVQQCQARAIWYQFGVDFLRDHDVNQMRTIDSAGDAGFADFAVLCGLLPLRQLRFLQEGKKKRKQRVLPDSRASVTSLLRYDPISYMYSDSVSRRVPGCRSPAR
ncbi:MAG: hypothetical protein O2856_01255 [Planctomycetota bacterium]|nr:hypothetical protein [Planctomycetota bacterium]